LNAPEERTVLRLKVVTAAEIDALICVLHLLQSHHVTLRRVTAQLHAIRGSATEVFEIEIELSASDVTPEALRVIAAKINQLSVVLAVVVGE
jgi:hypothetical protein